MLIAFFIFILLQTHDTTQRCDSHRAESLFWKNIARTMMMCAGAYFIHNIIICIYDVCHGAFFNVDALISDTLESYFEPGTHDKHLV